MKAKNILPIWQPVGYSTHLIAQRAAEKYGEKTSHTGTIDPMAEGVIIVLLGEERLKKYEYAEWKKTYEFEIAFGIKTDTFDGMGLIEDRGEPPVVENIARVLEGFVGEYEQDYPKFSTKKIKGKHLHEYARLGEEVKIPTKKGTIYDLKLLETYNIPTKKITENLIKRIKKVKGDFRQDIISNQWKKLESPKHLLVAKLEVTTSKGIYVRALSQDICRYLNTTGFVTNLVRTKNGEFSKKDCVEDKELLKK